MYIHSVVVYCIHAKTLLSWQGGMTDCNHLQHSLGELALCTPQSMHEQPMPNWATIKVQALQNVSPAMQPLTVHLEQHADRHPAAIQCQH
jgi:hypothetical protein